MTERCTTDAGGVRPRPEDEGTVAIRIVHTLSLPGTETQRLTEEVRTLRDMPGCLEAEAYASLSSPEDVTVVELWGDEESFAVVQTKRARPLGLMDELASVDEVRTEIYQHQRFASADGRWSPEGGTGSVVHWPAAGGVRIVIQSCFVSPGEEGRSLLFNEAGTRREPGCLEYAWKVSIEEPTHVLLTELWADQQLYDRHWALRGRSGETGKPRRRAERKFGSNGAEFYRHHEFRRLYDRWLPADATTWSTTVDWPN